MDHYTVVKKAMIKETCEHGVMYLESATLNSRWDIIIKKQHQNSITSDNSLTGMVMVGNDHKRIYILGNSEETDPGKTSKVNVKMSYLLELAVQ